MSSDWNYYPNNSLLRDLADNHTDTRIGSYAGSERKTQVGICSTKTCRLNRVKQTEDIGDGWCKECGNALFYKWLTKKEMSRKRAHIPSEARRGL